MSYISIKWFDGEKIDARKIHSVSRHPGAELPRPTPIHAIKWDDIKFADGHGPVVRVNG